VVVCATTTRATTRAATRATASKDVPFPAATVMGIVKTILMPPVQMDQGVFRVVWYVGVTTMEGARQTEEKLLQIVLIVKVKVTFAHVIAITVSQIQMQIVGQVMAMLDVVIG
jgi:hypothetical protein